jgi:hypothetical protein
MIKYTFASLIVIFLLQTEMTAQTYTDEKGLMQNSVRIKNDRQLNYARALSLAREKKWSTEIKLLNGGKARLSGVDPFGLPIYVKSTSNAIAAATTRANQLWPGGASGLNLSGSSAAINNKLAVWEYGGIPLSTHVEFGGRLLQKDNTSSTTSDHATHVSGTLIASGVNPVAKGMAYGIQRLLSYDETNDLSEMTAEAANGLLLSSHSYGIVAGWEYNTDKSRWEFNGRPGENDDYKYGYYSADAALLDSILYNAPNYIMVNAAGNDRSTNGPAVGEAYYRPNASGAMVAAGNRPSGINSNDGYDILAGYGIAKNNITIGAVNGIPNGYSKPEDVVMSNFSAWGPTDDGRIKPDLVANGVGVTSSISTNTTAYGTFNGTSMATPNATGSLLLLQEYYTKLKPNNFMRGATLKALAIHTTDEAGTSDGPDYKFGWGLLNVEKAAKVLTNAIPSNNSATSLDLVLEKNLVNGETFTQTVVASGKVPLKATIAWTDPVAAVNTVESTTLNDRTKKLINDLDIQITKSGSTYLPWTLDVNNPAGVALRANNSVDNAERIDVDNTIPGETYTITVTHKGILARGSQAYSLIVSGAGGAAYCGSKSLTGGAKIDSVSFSNIKLKSSVGCASYSFNTATTGTIQAKQNIPFNIQLSTCDASANSRIVKMYIDYNSDGDFADGNELVATSGTLASSTTSFSGNIVTPDSLTIGTLTLMRIIVQEASSALSVQPCGDYSRGETQDFKIRVINPTNDLMLANIVSPESNGCENASQNVTVEISNNGSVPQSNVPLSVIIKNGAATVATLTATFPGPIAALSTARYTLQTPFNSVAGATYTFIASVNLSNDQTVSNNTFTTTIPISAKPAAVTGEGVICGNNVSLKTLNSNTGNYFWYYTQTSAQPFALGKSTLTTTINPDRTYYVAKEAKATVGATSKLNFTSGGYGNLFSGNFMKFNATVPLTIESVRLYTSQSGQVKITVANNLTTSGTSGSYSYRPLSSTTIDVYASKPTALSESSNDPSDSGMLYVINLPVPVSGDCILILECLNGATIFRNNSITGNTYPMTVSNLFSFTGNSASLSSGINADNYYYFFYDTKISTGCTSDRTGIIASLSATPTISQVGDSLVSNIKSGIFQWTFNDTATISGSNSSSIKPTRTGNYKYTVVNAQGCGQTSPNINYIVTAINPVSPEEIKLAVSPNPNNGVFQLTFEVKSRSDLSIEIVNGSGQRVFVANQLGFIGKYNKQLNLQQFGSGFYLLKIQHDKKTYLQKIIIEK